MSFDSLKILVFIGNHGCQEKEDEGAAASEASGAEDAAATGAATGGGKG